MPKPAGLGVVAHDLNLDPRSKHMETYAYGCNIHYDVDYWPAGTHSLKHILIDILGEA